MKQKKRFLTADEISYFCYQLALIIDSGVPIYDGLTVLAAETREKSTAEANELLDSITSSLAMEKPLYQAMEDSGVFPVYCIKAVMAGELSGRLDEALRELTAYYEKEAAIGESIRNAVISPIIMMVISAVVIAVLTLKILPMFAEIFADFDAAVYETVSSSISISASAGMIMLIICIAAIIISAAMYIIYRNNSGFASSISAKFPLTAKTSETIALSRFTSAVSMMISSGLSAAEALQNAEGMCSNPLVEKKITECKKLVLSDVPFADAVEKTELLPVFYANTLRVSYRSGAFDAAWKKISDKLSEEADIRIASIVNSIEPALTAVLTVSAGVIMLTVMIPLINIMSAL